MDAEPIKSLVKVLIPLAVIALVAIVVKRRRLSAADAIGLKWPRMSHAAMWMVVYAALILGSDAVLHWRGPWDFEPWRQQAVLVSVFRVLAIGVLGPIAEELLFRGLAQYLIGRTRLRIPGSIIIPAAVWAGIHLEYSVDVITLLLVAGLLLGMARYQTASLLTPIAMHIMWNLYAVW